MEHARRHFINRGKKCEMTYYYYDKVLVSNYRLRSLTDYAGKMTLDSVVQLSVLLVEPDAAVLKASEGMELAGDFYQVTFFERVTYRIHKDGNLVRAYAADLSWVERTILGVPASILALLKGKVLLKGSLLLGGGWAYAVIGERKGEADENCIHCAVPGRAVMVLEKGERFVGAAHSDSAYSDYAVEALGLLGIFVLQSSGTEDAIESICEPALKRRMLQENIVGYEVFLPELKQLADDSGLMDEISRRLYMAFMRAL